MIEKILLRNFQIHERTEIAFDPFVSVITGESDSGKTSLLRALEWVATNQPPGDSFVGGFGRAPYAAVVLGVDGRKVGRKRGGDSNLYRIGNRDLRAFGVGVPKPVADLLNVGDINFSGQFDAPLWFLLSPGEVSKALDRIINLGLIDSSLANVGREVRKAKATVEVTEERLMNARTTKESLKWVAVLDRKLQKVERLTRQAEAARQYAEKAHRTLREVIASGEAYHEARTRLERFQVAWRAIEVWREKSERLNRLKAYEEQWERYQQALSRKLPNPAKLERLYRKYEAAALRHRTLSSLLLAVYQLKHEIDFAQVEIDSLKDQLKESVCPVCGQRIKL